jgi:solute carrier family 25 (mitochondrial citrate transporter), member 1
MLLTMQTTALSFPISLHLFLRIVDRQGTKAHLYSGTLNCFQQIVQKEGFVALYAGVVPRLGRVVPGQGIIFMSFEFIESQLEQNFKFFQ